MTSKEAMAHRRRDVNTTEEESSDAPRRPKRVEDPEKTSIRSAITYYRKKRKEGADWTPKPFSKLQAWCAARGIQPEELITGKRKLAEFFPS